MALFLDTNVILFLLREPDRIRPALRDRLLREPCRTSAASVYEIGFKRLLGKLDLPRGFDLEVALRDAEIDIAAIEPGHAALAARLQVDNRDPWDRLIVAQALMGDHELVSSDQGLDVLGAPRLW